MNQAEKCLKLKEFNSAYERYIELYDKDHSDFEAVRGLILCAGKIPDKENLTNPQKLVKRNLERAIKVLGQLVESSSGHPYFSQLETVLGLAVKYRNSLFEYGMLMAVEEELKAACNVLRELEPPVPEAVTYSETLNKVRPCPDTESVSDIACIKCGGQLLLDKKRSLCECRSCGVAYGTSFFSGEANKRAKEALVKQEFSEADQRYSYMLMLDPHDFEALRGRVLCAAKWSRPTIESDISNFWVNNIRSHVEYALEKALDDDKPYFMKYIEMLDEYSLVLAEENKLKPLKIRYVSKTKKAVNIVVDRDPEEDPKPVYARNATLKTIAEIEKEMGIIEARRIKHADKVRDICNQILEMDNEWLAGKAGK